AGGNSPSAARLYSAGINFRWVRSPVAPKMTIEHGCGTARVDKPSRSGLEAAGSAIRFMSQPHYAERRAVDKTKIRSQKFPRSGDFFNAGGACKAPVLEASGAKPRSFVARLLPGRFTTAAGTAG